MSISGTEFNSLATRTLGDLLKTVKSLAGVNQFATQEKDDIMNFVNRRRFAAYNESQAWPRFLIPSEKRFLGTDKFKCTFAASGTTEITHTFYLVGSIQSGDEEQIYPVYATHNLSQGGNDTSYQFVIYMTSTGVGLQWHLGKGLITGANFENPMSRPGTIGGTGALTKLYLKDDLGDSPGYTNLGWNFQPYPWLDTGVLTSGVGGLQTTIDPDVTGSNWIAPFTPQVAPKNFELTGSMYVPFYEYMIGDGSTAQIQFLQKKRIGEFLRIHREKAFVQRSAQDYDFYVDGEYGAKILNPGDSTQNAVFVTYKKPIYKITNAYNESSTTEIPGEFFPYLCQAVYADFLLMDGQTSKAQEAETKAQAIIFKELERVDIINNNNFPVTKFTTYVSKQAR